MWWAAALLGIAFIGRTYFFETIGGQNWCRAFRQVWSAAAYDLEGNDPYTLTGTMNPPNDDLVAFLYPPFTLPFCKLFALVPLDTAKVIFTTMNVLICLSLGLLTRRALIAQDGAHSPMFSAATAALLTAPVVLSSSTHWGLEDGHFSFLVTLALLAALVAQARQPARPLITAAWLAVASIKVQTMVPFMLLFLRRRDIRTWLFLGLVIIVLLLVAGNPVDLPQRISECLQANATHREPGRSADNSMLNRFSNTLIGFEHVFYRLGMVDRQTITALALTCVLGLGLWLAYLINIQQTLPRGACCSLVSLYSVLFIYHRLYDLSILILPLFYSASRLHTALRPARWCYVWVVAAILLALNAPYGEFLHIQYMQPPSVILRIFVLPSVTYLILSALVALFAAASLETRRGSLPAALTQGEEGLKPTAVLGGQTGSGAGVLAETSGTGAFGIV
jgi:hypothetical protein